MQRAQFWIGFSVLALLWFGTFTESVYAAPQTYTVQRGDTLTRIAIRFNSSVIAIVQANNIRNPNSLSPGQLLKIPGDGSPPVTPDSLTEPGVNDAAPDTPVYDVAANGAKWIDVNLSKQTMTAYVGNTPVKTTRVSTGTRAHPTVTGRFQIYVKLRSAPMSGGSRARGDFYYLPNVPNIMYFYRGYGIHGAYWHHNFGRVMSHGCINENLVDAKWFFDWAGPYVPPGVNIVWSSASNPGTTVVIHY